MKNLFRLAFSGCFLLGVIASVASAISIRHDVSVADYNNLALQDNYQATGYLADDQGQFCTCTLVSSSYILTASHCVDDDADGVVDSEFNFNTTGFGLGANVPGNITPNIASAAINPQWVSSNGDARFDVAILTLSTPITGVLPARITSLDPTGKVGTMIGYGEQGLGDFFPESIPGANNRLAAQNIIDASNGLIQTDFDSPTGNTSTLGFSSPIALEGTTGPGDSGGPIFADFNGISLIVGTLNGGANEVGEYPSEYGDVSDWAALRNPQNLLFLAGFGITPFVPLPGDYNQDGQVDAADYTVWRDAESQTGTGLAADGNGDGSVNTIDYNLWVTNFGQSADASATAIPEPTAWVLVLIAAGTIGSLRSLTFSACLPNGH